MADRPSITPIRVPTPPVPPEPPVPSPLPILGNVPDVGEPPEIMEDFWFSGHGADFARDGNFNVTGAGMNVVAFAEAEHFQLGENLQGMIDFWAESGLISGGCLIDTNARNTKTGHSDSIGKWEIFTPDPKRPTDPYHHKRALSASHWHYITPPTGPSNQAWTPASLQAALKAGDAVALSIGQIIMLAGDWVESFDDIRTPATQPRWRGSTMYRKAASSVHLLKAFEQDKDPIAYSLLDVFADVPHADPKDKLNKLERSVKQFTQIQLEIKKGQWKRVEAMVAFITAARGPTAFTELHMLAHLLTKPPVPPGKDREGRYSMGLIQSLASEWLPPSAERDLKNKLTADEYQNLLSEGFEADKFLNTVLSNGYFGELALNNTPHFWPWNWKRFSDEHRSALNLVKDHVTSVSAPGVTAPIPAEAIARTAFGLHYLTDGFASGHMRVPRAMMGINGAVAAKLMHDVENKYGLVVENGLGYRWRAFGDSYLHPSEQRQMDLVRQLAVVRGGKANKEANYDNALRAVGSALLQLHYEAQRHIDEPKAAPFKPVLQKMRRPGMKNLRGDAYSSGVPGDGGYSAWLTQDIDAKIVYMEKHQPRPVRVGRSADENHPPLYDLFGNVSSYGGYAWFETKATSAFGANRTLRLSWHSNIAALEKDYSDLYHFAVLTAGMRGWLQGGETWLQQLETKLPEI